LNAEPIAIETSERLLVLAVDDQRFQRRVLASQLRQLGATEVLEADDGIEALALIDAHPNDIALIVTDIDMPSMDGLALLRQIGKRIPHVPIVVHSALDGQLLRSVEAMSRAFKVNLLATISKPATEESLAAAIEHARIAVTGSRPGRALQFDSDALSLALHGNQLEPWFQPKVRLTDGMPSGAEVLMRWRHPDHGILLPGAFIESLENSPLLRPSTLMLSARAAQVLGAARTDAAFTLGINVSPRLLGDPDFASTLANTIIDRGGAPENITLEVTERTIASCEGSALENLTRLRMRGFGLSIDDFGTGYSSLAQLTQAPFSELKVDQRFVSALGHDPRSEDLVRTTLDLAQRLGLYTVAEGVETEAQRQLLLEFGCEAAQGFLFAKPMPVFQWLSWMESINPASS
jgi:EAL domain-containing protein (putative c-di-GMP-specific phosphodiesterase class I)/CheY-like chemotaxis protein